MRQDKSTSDDDTITLTLLLQLEKRYIGRAAGEIYNQICIRAYENVLHLRFTSQFTFHKFSSLVSQILHIHEFVIRD